MPRFRIEDDNGQTLVLEGDSEPTADELEEIFKSRAPQAQPAPPPAAAPLEAPSGYGDPFLNSAASLAAPTIDRTRPTSINPQRERTSGAISRDFAAEPPISFERGFIEPFLSPTEIQPEESIVGLAPERVPTGAEMTESTGIPHALTIPTSAIVKTGAGVGQFMTSPTGIGQMTVAALPGVGLIQRAKFILDMAKGAGESAGSLVSAVEKAFKQPDKLTTDDYQHMAEDAANALVMLLGAGKMTAHEFSRATGIRAPLGRVLEGDKKRLSKDLADQLLKAEFTPEPTGGMALVQPVDAAKASVEDYQGEPGEVVVTAEELKGPAKAEAPGVATEAAAEIGATFNPTKQSGSMLMEGLTKQQQADLAKIQPAQWEFTDPATSPTAGLTFYVPEGATKAEIVAASKQKRAEYLTPALRTKDGKIVVGEKGKSHDDIYEANPKDDALLDNPEHIFVVDQVMPGAEKKPLTRQEAAKLLHEPGDLNSQRLREIQESKPASVNAPKEAVAGTGEQPKPATAIPLTVETGRGEVSYDIPPTIPNIHGDTRHGQSSGTAVSSGGRPDVITGGLRRSESTKGSADAGAHESNVPVRETLQGEEGTGSNVGAKPGRAVKPVIVERINKRDKRDWSKLPQQFELDAVRAAFSDIKELFPKKAISQRVRASRATTFSELREIVDETLTKYRPELKPPTTPPASVGEAGFEPGPGARTATESQKPAAPESYEGTGLKHAIDELERVSYGFKERTPQEKQNMAQAWIRAGETIATNWKAAQELAQALTDNPKRGLTGDESALILRAKVHLQNAINDAAEKTFSSDPAIKTEGEMALARLMGEMNQLLDAVAERGSEWGREGRWRQALAYEDFTFATQERLLRASKGGEPLTNTERNKLLAEIETHKARVAQLEKDLAAAKVKDAQANVTDTVTTVRTQAKKDKAAGRVRDLAAEQKAVVDHLKEQFKENDADLSGEGISIRKLMELLVEREGITERLKMEDRIHEILQAEVDPTITREQAMDLMSGYGKSRLPNPAFAKRTVRDINAQILSVRKLLDYFKGQRPKLTGQLRDAPSQIQRNWIKMVNEAKKAFHLEDTGDNAKLVKSAIDAINTRLTNRIKDLKSEIVTRYKIIRERSPSPYNAETLELRRELEEVQKAHKEIFGEPTLSDAQRLDRAEKAAERQIVELQRQLDSGEIFSKRQQAFGLSSPKLEAAKARRDELEAQRKWAREAAQPKPEPHEQFALNYLLRLRQRAAEYGERMVNGDFLKAVKPPREHGPDVLKAMAEVEQSKQNFYQARYEAAQRLRSVPRKIWDGIRATKDAFVNIKSSFDFSAPRQMFLAILGNSTEMLTNPIAGTKLMFKPLGKMFEAWASESKSAQIEQWRRSRPNATSGADKTAGIQYTELHTTDFTKAEENARSVLDEWAKLPLKTGNVVKTAATALPKLASRGVRMSNRAFITALNVQRAALFDYLLAVNYKDRAPTDAELRVVGNLVNVSTGRGKLSRGVAKVTGEVLWSPSLLASRLQVLTGQPLWTGLLSGDAKGSFRARKIVAKQYARWLISGAALYGISRLFTDDEEAEPTSSDLGKVVRGDTRIDPWAGFQQPIVAASRIVTGESTSIEGKARDINAGEVIWNFFKNKTRPDVVAIVKGVIAAIDSGKDERDVRVTPKEAAMEMLPVPLALQDVIKVMRENGMAEGAIIQVLSEFGVGVNVYEEYERQR